MKKIILSICVSLVFLTGYSQTSIIMNGVGANTSGNFSVTVPNGRTVGSIQTYTNSAFNGTTSTIALEGSNNEVRWETVYADDNTTPLSHTTTSGEKGYPFLLNTIHYKYYRIVYTKGNASAGTLTSILNAQ